MALTLQKVDFVISPGRVWHDFCAMRLTPLFRSHFGMSAKNQIPADARLDVEFDKAFEQLQQLVDFSLIDSMFPLAPQSVYTNALVLWMLVYQRISSDSSLEAAVKKMIEAQPAFLRPNKRIKEGQLSTATGAYSRARTRLPLEAAQWLAEEVSQSLIDASPPTYRGWRLFLVDGTTITLAPEEELQAAFPPALNQHGEGVWPVALLVVAHELASGAALIPEVGPQNGPHAVSETSLVRGCLEQMPVDGIVMADSGFGIFHVAHMARRTGHRFLLRLTQIRFEAYRKKATLESEGENWKTYLHTWHPSAKERKKHPDLPADVALEVRLHEIVIHEGLTVCLVTDLLDEEDTASALSGVYKHRYHVEFDIRNLKIVLDLETIRAKSVEMFRKELLMSVVVYNLVTQFRRQAAKLADLPPRRLSFKRTWTTFCTFLLSAMHTDAKPWRERYRMALSYAMHDKLPHRPGRSYKREAYGRRPKSAHFKKRKPTRDPTGDNPK